MPNHAKMNYHLFSNAIQGTSNFRYSQDMSKKRQVAQVWGRMKGHATSSMIGRSSSSCPVHTGISRYSRLQSRPSPCRTTALCNLLSAWPGLRCSRQGTNGQEETAMHIHTHKDVHICSLRTSIYIYICVCAWEIIYIYMYLNVFDVCIRLRMFDMQGKQFFVQPRCWLKIS